MSKSILQNVLVRVNAVDISQWCRSVTLDSVKTEEDVTGWDGPYRQFAPGLDETQIDLELFRGVDTDHLLSRTFDPASVVVVDVAPSNDVATALILADDLILGPELIPSGGDSVVFSVPCRLMSRQPITGSVGDPAIGTLTFKAISALTVGYG